MYCVGKIDREKFACIAKVITTDEVIITDERIAHSNLHQNAFERFGKYIPEVLSQPDFSLPINDPIRCSDQTNRIGTGKDSP